jgi:ubiquinone/menaquinone biosynthesis C-methylase UbiE/DNA-binding transcriptional ArsR family regulator
MAAASALLDWMTALADPTRARTLRLVERQELSVADLCAVLQLPQSTMSRHLKVLADEGWVSARADGTSRLYRLAIDRLDPSARRLWSLVRDETAATPLAEQDDRRLEGVLAERQTRSQAFFASSAGQWDRLRREMYGDRFDLQALAGLLDADWTVGDLACGTGQVTTALAPFVRRVIAVDRSRAMLAAARKRLGSAEHVDLRQGTLEALPIDDRSLDAGVMSLALHYVSDPLAALRETARVLRPGGRLLVIDLLEHERQEYRQAMGHVWLGFGRDQMTGWLAEAGFENARVLPLPAAPQAQGPALLAATARRRDDKRNNGRTR